MRRVAVAGIDASEMMDVDLQPPGVAEVHPPGQHNFSLFPSPLVGCRPHPFLSVMALKAPKPRFCFICFSL